MLTEAKKTQWDAFLGRSGLDAGLDFEKTISKLCDFLNLPLKAASLQKAFHMKWMPGGPWK
jgi:hypothetical protein